MQESHPLVKHLMGFAQERFKFDRPPKLFFKQDQENAKNVLGKTAFYDPQQQSITLFTTNRHPKDILRSLAHELVHHTQNLRGDFNSSSSTGFRLGYAQENPDLRELEREAYEQGNLCFRDWEDGYKKQLQEVKFLKESKKMTKKITKKTLEGFIRRVLSEQMTSRERAAMIARKNREMGLGMGPDDEETLGNVFRNAPADGTPRVNRQQQDAMDRTRGDKELSNVPTTYMGGRTGADEDEVILRTRAANKANIDRKSRQQSKFLRRAGFRNMKQLQKRVGAQPTGIYDAETMNAIKAFQKRLGFDLDGQDGVYGPATARRLAARQDVRVNQGDISDISSPNVPRSIRKTGPAPDNRSIAQIAGVDPKMIKTDRTADLTLPSGFVKNPLESEDENADRYMAFQNRRDAEELGFPPAKTATAKKRSQPINVKESIDPLGEGHCSGPSPGKRDAKNKVVLDEKEDENQKCEKCKNCKCPGGAKACDRCKNCKCDEKDNKMKDDKKKDGKDGFPDLTGDGKVTQADILKGRGVKLAEGYKIYTPEHEQALYESRFNDRNEKIFDKLKKLWTK